MCSVTQSAACVFVCVCVCTDVCTCVGGEVKGPEQGEDASSQRTEFNYLNSKLISKRWK